MLSHQTAPCSFSPPPKKNLPPLWKKGGEKCRDFILQHRRFAHSFTWDGSWMEQASWKVIGAWECLTWRKQSECSWPSGNWTGNMESNPFQAERKTKRKWSRQCDKIVQSPQRQHFRRKKGFYSITLANKLQQKKTKQHNFFLFYRQQCSYSWYMKTQTWIWYKNN